MGYGRLLRCTLFVRRQVMQMKWNEKCKSQEKLSLHPCNLKRRDLVLLMQVHLCLLKSVSLNEFILQLFSPSFSHYDPSLE